MSKLFNFGIEEKSKQQMKKSKLASFTLAIAFSLLLVQCTGSNEKKLHKELIKRAAELNASTPVALDEHTRFDSVGVTADNVFQYFYTITNIDNPHQLIASQKNEMLDTMDKMYANDRSLQFFAINKVTMEYIYRDMDRNVIDIITIETEKYRMNKKQH